MKRLALCVLMSASLVMNSVTAFAYDYSTIREESSSQVYDSAKFYIDSHLPKLVGMEDSNGLGTGLVNYVNLHSDSGNVNLDFLRKGSGNPVNRVVFPSNPSSGAFIGSANSLTVSRESLLDSSSSNYTPAINAYFYWDNEYAENKMDTYDKLIFNTGSSYKFVSVPVSSNESTDSVEIINTTINTLDGSEALNRVADSDIKANELVGDTLFIPVGIPVSVYNKYLTEQSADSDITLYKVIVHRNSDKTKGVSVSVDNRGILSVGNNESLGENNSIDVDIEYIYKFKDGSDLYNKYGKLGSATKTVSVYKDYPTMYRENSKKLPFYGDYRGSVDKFFYMDEHLDNLFVNGYLGSTKTVREADNSFVSADEAVVNWGFNAWWDDDITKSGLDVSKVRTMQGFLNQTDKKPVVKVTPEAVNASKDSLYMKGQFFTSFSDEFTKISTITYRGSVFTYAFDSSYGKNNSNSITVNEMTRNGGQAISYLLWDTGIDTSGLKYGENRTKPSDADNVYNLALLSSRIKDAVEASGSRTRLSGWSVYSINYDDRVALAYGYHDNASIGGVDVKPEYVMGIPLDTAIMNIEPVEVPDMVLYKKYYYLNGELSDADKEKIGAMLTRLNGDDWWKSHSSEIPDRASYDADSQSWYINMKILHKKYKIPLTGGKTVKYRDSYTISEYADTLDEPTNPYYAINSYLSNIDYKYDDKDKLTIEDSDILRESVPMGELNRTYLVNLKTASGNLVKENVPVTFRVAITQRAVNKLIAELPKSLDSDEELAKTAVNEIEGYINKEYHNLVSRMKNGDTEVLSIGVDDESYPTVTVRYDNGYTESSNTDLAYKFIESPMGEVYVDGDSYESMDTSVIQEEAEKVLAKYLEANGDSIDSYSDFSINSLDDYTNLHRIVKGERKYFDWDNSKYYLLKSTNADGKQKTFTFIVHPSVDLIDSIDTDFMVGAERELTKEEYSKIVSTASRYDLMDGWIYPELSNVKYDFVPVSDELAKVTVYTNLDKYGHANGKFTIQLKFTGFPQDKDLYDSFELDTDLVVSGSNLVHNDSDDWEAWGRPKPACPKTMKIITEVPAKPVEEPEKPKVSDSNIPKVSDSNIPKKHEPKRDKPSPKENVEPKVPNDKDYPRENEPKDPTVITYIPQGNGGTEDLFKKDGSVNGASIEKEQEEERIRQEMLDNELKAKNMKANTRGAVKTADTRHMILMFAMFMGSAVLFAITILAKKKYEDNIG